MLRRHLLMRESFANHPVARSPSFPCRRESIAKSPVFVLYAIGPLDSRLRRNDGWLASGWLANDSRISNIENNNGHVQLPGDCHDDGGRKKTSNPQRRKCPAVHDTSNPEYIGGDSSPGPTVLRPSSGGHAGCNWGRYREGKQAASMSCISRAAT